MKKQLWVFAGILALALVMIPLIGATAAGRTARRCRPGRWRRSPRTAGWPAGAPGSGRAGPGWRAAGRRVAG